MPLDTKNEMTAEEIDAVRAEVRAVMEGEAVTMAACAREAGVAYGTFSSWMGSTYAGRNDKIAAQARNWLRARKVKAETQALAPAAPRFVATPSAEAFQLVFQHAQHMPDFAVVVGAPGVGKSSAACHYTRSNPNVFKIVANPMLGTPRAVLEEFSRVIGSFQGGQLHKVQRALIAKLRGTGALLMVDEAQHLTSVALDQVRSIHDEAEIGVVLLGNPAIYGRLEGGGARRSDFAQLFSRVGMRLSRKAPEKGDIEALLDAWAVDGAEERRFLQGIARKPGALRSMTKTLKLAHMLAAVAKARPDLGHLRDAYAQLGATDLSAAEAD
jgi:hypothetical protein